MQKADFLGKNVSLREIKVKFRAQAIFSWKRHNPLVHKI
jgi:hypothetical protein